MTFGAPYWLWALAVVPLLGFLFLGNEQRRKTLLERIVASRLVPLLAGSLSPGRRMMRFGVLLLGLTSLIVSMARPQHGYTWEENKRKGRDVFLAIDVSKSMLATDVQPSRLARAKLAAQDILGQLQGDRVGLIAFAGSSFVQAPLTVDYGAVKDSLDELDPGIIPLGGTNIAGVINETARAFDKSESESRCLILFTDGDELDADGVAAARAQAHNFRIFTVGIGSREGAIIPVPGDDGGTSFIKNPEGQIVKTKLDENRLQQIAAATGGFYTHLQNGPEEMKRIILDGLGRMKEHDIDARTSQSPIERYQWPLALGALLVVSSMFIREKRRVPAGRKSKAALQSALFLFCMWAGAGHARALPPNKGVDLYNDKKYKESYDSFQEQLLRNPDSQALQFDIGTSAYKTGEYDKAIEAFGKAITSSEPGIREKAEYNLGNTLCMRGNKQEAKEAKLKDWNNAIQHYDEALKIDPNNKDTAFNRDVVKKLIEELNKPQPPEQKQDKKDQENQDKKDQDKKDQEKQDQQNQQNQQNQKKDQQQDQKNDPQDQKKNGQQDPKNSDQGSGKNDQQKQDGKQDSKEQKDQDSKDGGNSQNNSQPNPQQQSKGENGKNDASGQNKPGDEKNSQGKQDEKKNDQAGSPGQNSEQRPNDGNPTPQNGNDSATNPPQPPSSPSQEPGKKYSGDIKPQQPQGPQENAQPGGEREEAFVPGQAQPMSPTQALGVVESEKDEEAKGVLIERKQATSVLKDW